MDMDFDEKMFGIKYIHYDTYINAIGLYFFLASEARQGLDLLGICIRVKKEHMHE
jgi:hypothetical protein